MAITYEEWDNNKDRLSFVKHHQTELEHAAGVEIPDERAEMSQWLSNNKHVITKALNAEADTDDSEASESNGGDDE